MRLIGYLGVVSPQHCEHRFHTVFAFRLTGAFHFAPIRWALILPLDGAGDVARHSLACIPLLSFPSVLSLLRHTMHTIGQSSSQKTTMHPMAIPILAMFDNPLLCLRLLISPSVASVFIVFMAIVNQITMSLVIIFFMNLFFSFRYLLTFHLWCFFLLLHALFLLFSSSNSFSCSSISGWGSPIVTGFSGLASGWTVLCSLENTGCLKLNSTGLKLVCSTVTSATSVCVSGSFSGSGFGRLFGRTGFLGWTGINSSSSPEASGSSVSRNERYWSLHPDPKNWSSSFSPKLWCSSGDAKFASSPKSDWSAFAT